MLSTNNSIIWKPYDKQQFFSTCKRLKKRTFVALGGVVCYVAKRMWASVWSSAMKKHLGNEHVSGTDTAGTNGVLQHVTLEQTTWRKFQMCSQFWNMFCFANALFLHEIWLNITSPGKWVWCCSLSLINGNWILSGGGFPNCKIWKKIHINDILWKFAPEGS